MGESLEIFGRSQAWRILEILREKISMDGRRRKSLKERLGLSGIGCCGGAAWGFRPATLSVRDDEEQQEEEDRIQLVDHHHPNIVIPAAESLPTSPTSPCTGMNLAAALAAERQFRVALDTSNEGTTSSSPSPSSTAGNMNETLRSPPAETGEGTPPRMSLMRLLEETGGYEEEEGGGGGGGGGSEWAAACCCVCMWRKKGSAFIPCGHTFCRVCTRELWLNRGCCPLCNRPIIEILDIY